MMYVRTKNPFNQPPLRKSVIQSAIMGSNSMTEACKKVGCSYNTFRKWAKAYDLWSPNQSGRGISKNKPYKPSFDDVDLQSINNIQQAFGYNDD